MKRTFQFELPGFMYSPLWRAPVDFELPGILPQSFHSHRRIRAEEKKEEDKEKKNASVILNEPHSRVNLRMNKKRKAHKLDILLRLHITLKNTFDFLLRSEYFSLVQKCLQVFILQHQHYK